MANTSRSDADFYRLVYQLMGPLPGESQGERRGRRRQRFWARQRVAPWDGGPLPTESEFFEVQCYDLTPAGFSFFLPSRPTFQWLVAAFSGPTGVIYVGAQVAHCASVLLHASGLVEHIEGRASHVSYRSPDGQWAKPMVLVGCRFVKRLEESRQ